MTDAYRSENESLQARNRQLEEDLATQRARVEELERRAASEEDVLFRLRAALDDGSRAPRRWPLLASALIAGVGLVGAWLVTRVHAPPPSAPAMGLVAGARPLGGLGGLAGESAPGLRLEIEGRTILVPIEGAEDRAGYKYRESGHRSAWFTSVGSEAGGPRLDCSQQAPRDLGHVYVHGVGDFLSPEHGGLPAPLTLLTVRIGGAEGGYRLAQDGQATVSVRSEDGQVIGSFEADMSKVEDTTRPAPAGAPIVRVRGSFRLPLAPLDPSDTAP